MLTYKSLSKCLTATTVLLIISCSNHIEEVSKPLPKTPDTTQPTTTSIYPVNNELNASTNTAISVTFSEEIDKSSTTLENVKIYQIPASGPLLPIDIEPESLIFNVSNNTLNFRLSQTLEFDTRYRVEIKADPLTDNGVKDLAGNLLTTNEEGMFAWTFTSKEDLPLAIKSVIPRTTATNIDPKSDIQIVFDSRYLPDDAIINSSILSITMGSGQSIEGRFSYNEPSHTATFTPILNMPFKQTINVAIDISTSTNTNIASHNWTFTIREGKITASNASMIEANDDDIWGGYNLTKSEMKYPETTHFQSITDALGNTTVFWRQSQSRGNPQLWANRHDHKRGWDTDIVGTVSGTSISPVYKDQYIRTLKSVVDPIGNITVAWLVESYDGLFDLWANYYDIETGWQKDQDGKITAVRLENNDSASVDGFNMAVDDSGNVTVVLSQNGFIYANRFNNSTKKWNDIFAGSLARKIEINGGAISSGIGYPPHNPPKLIVDSVGNVVVVWSRKFLNGYALESTRYNISSGWLPRSERIESTIDGGKIFDVNMVIDPGNNITVSWQQIEIDPVNGDYTNLWSNHFTQNQGWQIDNSGISNPNQIDFSLNKVAFENERQIVHTKLATDNLGNNYAVWQKNGSIWSSRRDISSNTWSIAEALDPFGWGQWQEDSNLITDGFSNATLVWQTDTGVYSKRYHANQGWQITERLDAASGNVIHWSVSVIPDIFGNINISWIQPTNNSTADSLWYNRYNLSSNSWYKKSNGEADSRVLESDNSNSTSHNRMVVDPYGNVTITWLQSDGNFINIYANRFDVSSDTWWTNSNGEISGLPIDNEADFDVLTQYYSNYSPQLFVEPNGSVTIIWIQPNRSFGFDLWANRYE